MIRNMRKIIVALFIMLVAVLCKMTYPMHEACKKSDIETIKTLISQGANINAKIGPWEKTALMYACDKENIPLVEYLLAKGADVNLKNKNGKTALMYAKSNGHTETVHLLKEAGALE